MSQSGVLGRLEARLDEVGLRRGRELLAVWGRACRPLAEAGLDSPAAVPGWAWTLDSDEADEVLRALVGLAQAGDEIAAVTALVCLRPGVLALVDQTRVPVGELLSELTAVMLGFRLARRRRVAAGLLLDTRKRLARRGATRVVPEGDTRASLAGLAAPGELGAGDRLPERLAGVVRDAWLAGVVSADAARLVLSTRLLGEPATAVARRLGVQPKALRARRSRAEARIARALSRERRGSALGGVCDREGRPWG